MNNLDYKHLLRSIGNLDMGIHPNIVEECYFINTKKNIVFHMYDDRVLDIVADSIEILRPLYEKYNSWILDYDRKQIDSLFRK